MGAKKVQGIIIKDHKVLLSSESEKSVGIKSFFTGSINQDENEYDAIKRKLKEELNLECEITFKFRKEQSKEITTFLIDLTGSEINDIEVINGFNAEDNHKNLQWVDLSDKDYFSSYEIYYIKQLIDECIENQYEAMWTNIIVDKYFNNSISRKYLNKKYLEKQRRIKDLDEGKNEKLKIMSMALIVGILFNYFFIWDTLGISALIFVSVIIGFSVFAVYSKVDLKNRLGWMFLIPIISLSLTYSIYNNWVLRGINTIIIPLLIVSYIVVIRYENINDMGMSFISRIFGRVFSKSFGTIPKFFYFTKEIVNSRKEIKENTTQKNIIMGLIISLPLLFIIVMLLTSADMMFKYYLENISQNLFQFNLGSLIGHSFVIVIVTLYMFGFLWSLKYEDKEYQAKETVKDFAKWEPVTVITIIFVICITYLLFTVVQFSYLYGGVKNVLPSGLTYAEYARKGFFELVLVTLINFTIVILSVKFTKKNNLKINRIANISYSALIIFTFNMLFSANYKMNLYEKAFGFTRLRIFVHVFMLLLAILLTIVLLGIWVKRVKVLKSAIIATMVVYIALNYINVDKIIARKNIERYQEINIIDVQYLKALSYDASSEIVKLLDVDSITIRNEIKKYIEGEKKRLNKYYNHWYEFNYYKSKFLKINE